jgi:hypothetical protein
VETRDKRRHGLTRRAFSDCRQRPAKACGPACVAMFGAMLFRLDLYTGRAGHHVARAAHAT